MTMIKAEYTGRIQRRERKIDALVQALTTAGLPLPDEVEGGGGGKDFDFNPLGHVREALGNKEAMASSTADKENSQRGSQKMR
mmetsp:Transcript_25744/g.62052  ORF Transcript_25744/g.62052 Transcript_25744/m.62052 type:complete len:83 (+) Transcript_25744:161-409(+)